jgi:protein-S-isoprenylcysteine O-methyltransferase Ste14
VFTRFREWQGANTRFAPTRPVSYRIALFSLGLIIGGYWLRVLRMAREARQKTGRAANFMPAERVGRALRIAWIPIVIVWIAQPFVASLLVPNQRLIAPLIANPWIAWISAVVTAVCFWLSRICWKTMGKNWRMGIDPAERTSLVLAGPYQYVRHPIYALSQLMMLATLAAIPSPLMICAGIGHVLLLQWEARREEKHLYNTHGDDYAQYCVRVGRFFPGRSLLRSSAQSGTE